VGLLETHGREGTAEAAVGLEILARRRVSYRHQELEEMDLPGILARRPELVLIDELAHTNVPGVEHAKRYQDIADVRAAGIDVLSTVNVQHLESLNDRVAELTGTRVRETVPDDALACAEEIVLIDVTPETLLERLRAGKVYPPERIDAALNNFFRIENLSALREVALRQVAEEVEAKRIVTEVVGTRGDGIGDDAAQAVGERLLAPSGSSAAPGARPSASAPSSTCCGCAALGRSTSRARGRWRRCASSPPCWARTCWWRSPMTSPRPSRAWPPSAGRPTS
jgi:two-component system sensor histidine kinase KdpD